MVREVGDHRSAKAWAQQSRSSGKPDLVLTDVDKNSAWKMLSKSLSFRDSSSRERRSDLVAT